MSSPNLIGKKNILSASSDAVYLLTGDGDNHARWRSEKQQRIYSTKLIKAMQQIRLNSSSAKSVREAADRTLAVSARGKTLWSRAILANRIKLKFRKQRRRRPTPIPAITTVARRTRPRRKRRVSVVRLSKKSKPEVNRKIRVLGRLIPGCGKESVPVILEEATDYIQALEMQIRAMNSLAELLSSNGGSALPPPPI